MAFHIQTSMVGEAMVLFAGMSRTLRVAGAAAAPRKAPGSRTKPFDVRRGEIMDAGEKSFLGKGVAATVVDDITTAAGVAKGTFYLYFSSKDDFLDALRARFVERALQLMQERVEAQKPGDWSARLAAWIDMGVATYLDTISLHHVLFHGAHVSVQAGASENERKVIGSLADLLREGAEADAWRVDDADMMAVFLYHAMHGGLDHAAAVQKPPNRRKLARSIKDFFEGALRAR